MNCQMPTDYVPKTSEELTQFTAAKTEAAESEEATYDYSDEELVRRARECYLLGINTSSEWREDALEDLEFLAGEQWDSNVKSIRDTQGRPALTVNRLPQFVRQITNEQRQSKPSVTVNPVDSVGDIRTAEVLQGIIRNIEYSSNADAAYASGGQYAAVTGLGYWDVAAEYEGERSFEQRLTIRRIRNPMSVVMDPGAKEQAGDDARWCIISTDISKAEWEATYPGKELPKGGNWDGQGDAAADWVATDGVRIHEYRYITEETDTLYDVSGLDDIHAAALKLAGLDSSTGAILESEVGPQFAERLKDFKLPTRSTTRRKACWAKVAGDEVVEKGELAGRYLQLVRVVGAELDINGRAIYEGIVRHAKDTQRALNYFVSAETEAIALAPKAPFIAAEGQIEGYETLWENANQKPVSYLPYKPLAIGGVAVPPPQRIMAEANIAAITQARMQAGEDLSGVTGIYPTQFGAPAPEQSGKAILARQSQGQTSNFHFTDNLAMAIRYTGRILIDLIPKIYSGARVLRILGEDGEQEMVPVNGADGEFRGEPAIQNGQPVIQLDAGRYDVAVSMGPSYLSRRQEAAAQMLELARINPALTQVAGDLMVASMDIPGGQVIADRLRKLLPPEIRPPDENQPPPQVMAQQLQQLQQQAQMMQGMIGQLSQALHNAHDRIDAKEQDIASKERIALINAQTELVKTAASLKSDQAIALLDNTTSLIHRRLELDGINQPSDDTSTAEAPRGVSAVLKQLQQPTPTSQPPGVPNARQLSVPPGVPRPAPGGGPGGPPGVPPAGFPFGPGGNGA